MYAMNFFTIFFVRCGLIGWVLWGLSLLTAALVVQYLLAIRRRNLLPESVDRQIRELLAGRKYREVIDLTDAQPSLLAGTVHAALAEAAHGYAAMERALEEAAEQRTTQLLRSVESLNLIGNIAPMLGLMGTVWGMILVFFEIVARNEMPAPAGLADGIGTALVTTLLGLGIAIPALSVYSILRSRIDAMSAEAMICAQELIAPFRPQHRPAEHAAHHG
jgi:biopolymer transport protein ExbB